MCVGSRLSVKVSQMNNTGKEGVIRAHCFTNISSQSLGCTTFGNAYGEAKCRAEHVGETKWFS